MGVSELGATWLHGVDGNPAAALLQRHGLVESGRSAAGRPSVWLRSDGAAADRSLIRRVCSAFQGAIQECENGGVECDGVSVADHVRRAWGAERATILRDAGLAEDPAGRRARELLDATWAYYESSQCAMDGCGTLAEQGVVSLQLFDELDGRNVPSRVLAGGFGAAMRALADEAIAAGAEIKTGAPAVSVHWGAAAEGGEGVRVGCVDGQTHRADAVCVALPLPPLRRLLFEPPLPEYKTNVMETQLRLGQVEKLFVRFRRTGGGGAAQGAAACPSGVGPHPGGSGGSGSEGDGYSDSSGDSSGEGGGGVGALPRCIRFLWTADATAEEAAAAGSDDDTGSDWTRGLFALCAAQGSTREDVLVGWLTGESAARTRGLTNEELLTQLTVGLGCFLAQPQLQGWVPDACRVTRWAESELSGGSYTFLTPDASADASELLAAPLEIPGGGPAVLFCGEATSHGLFGTVGGAMLSGEREAERLLRAWGRAEATA